MNQPRDDEIPITTRDGLLTYEGVEEMDDGTTYTAWSDLHNRLVYLADVTCRVLVDFDSLDLAALWTEWNNSERRTVGFKDWAMLRTYEPEAFDDVEYCGDCGVPHHTDDLHYIGDDETDVCEPCLAKYHPCYHCEELYLTGNLDTIGGEVVCPRCVENTYTWCDACDAYFHDESGHEHDDKCGCESPAQAFTIRNDGHGPLANDERTTVTLPVGTISEVGVDAIAMAIRRHSDIAWTPVYERYRRGEIPPEDYSPVAILRDKSYQLAASLEVLGDQWVLKKGGTYPKRLSSHAYKNFGIKLSPDLLSEVGNIGAAHSQGSDYQVEVTRDLNQSPEEFANEDSCWWQSYYHGRCALKSNGGFGLRTFRDGYTYATGRAWVMPLRLTGAAVQPRPVLTDRCRDANCCPQPAPVDAGLAPTFDTTTPDAFVVFNGYGDLEGFAPARIMAYLSGWTYRKITFRCAPMFVNSEAGYLIAPEELAQKYTNGGLDLTVDQHAHLFDDEQAAAIKHAMQDAINSTTDQREPIHA